MKTITSQFTKRLLQAAGCGLVLLAGSAFASTTSIEGVVKDPGGKPISGADVRIEGKGSSAQTTKTDSKGHYYYNGLTTGHTYRVSLLVNKEVKASINNVSAKNEPNKLNFDLKKNSAGSPAAGVPAKKKTHMVYIPPETGSNMGGRWVEVDDNGVGTSAEGSEKVDKRNGNLLLRMQQNAGHTGGN